MRKYRKLYFYILNKTHEGNSSVCHLLNVIQGTVQNSTFPNGRSLGYLEPFKDKD